MKKFISLVAIAAIFLSSCGKINDRINDLDSRLDLLEGTTIPSIDEQIDNINVSITDLKSVDSELHQLIDALKAEADEHASLIVALQDKDTELEDDIAALEEYVDSEITATEDWAEATFATLEQYAEVQSEISSIKALIEQYKTEITEAYTEAIANAIITSETSMKQWVGEQLAGYYTIAEIDAKLESLQQSINDLNESLADEIATLSGRVDAMKTELTDAYTKAISEAIETNNGVIDAKISEEINTVNTRIDSEVEAINKRIDSLEERIEALEDIINKIQALDIEFDNTEGLVCYPGASVEVGYTIVGGDVKTEIESFGDGGWSASVIKASDTTGKIRVKSPEDATSGKVIVLATSGIGGSVMKSLYFEQGVLADIQNTYEVDWEACTLQVALKTNLDYTVNIPADAQSWISVADTRAALRTETLTFTIAENPEDEPERSAVIEIVNELGDVLQSFEIVQKLQPSSNPIQFADQYAKLVCVEKFDTNGDGELSYKEAAAVTEIESNFFGDYASVVTSFDEFQYFINIRGLGDKSWISYGPFEDCLMLTSIILPASLEYIGAHSFSGCRNLTDILIPKSVTLIAAYSFEYCSSLKSMQVPDNVVEICDGSFYNCSNLTNIEIPAGVTTIGAGAFYGCRSLTEIVIPDGVTSIGSDAFNGCNSLKNIRIPDGVVMVKNNTFENCSSLTEIIIPDGVISIGSDAFNGCNSLKNIRIPDGVVMVSDGTFKGCSSLTEIVIPEGVTSIGSGAFYGCRSLKNIRIPNTVVKMGEYTRNNSSNNSSGGLIVSYEGVFSECISLTSVILPENLSTIGDCFAMGCVNLENIIIPANVESIGTYAYNGCAQLSSVYIKSLIPPSLGYRYSFDGNSSKRKIYVPMESVEAYKTAEYWSDYADSIVGYDFAE